MLAPLAQSDDAWGRPLVPSESGIRILMIHHSQVINKSGVQKWIVTASNLSSKWRPLGEYATVWHPPLYSDSVESRGIRIMS